MIKDLDPRFPAKVRLRGRTFERRSGSTRNNQADPKNRMSLSLKTDQNGHLFQARVRNRAGAPLTMQGVEAALSDVPCAYAFVSLHRSSTSPSTQDFVTSPLQCQPFTISVAQLSFSLEQAALRSATMTRIRPPTPIQPPASGP